MRMRAMCRHTYGGRVLSEGELFDAEARFVPVLVALGLAQVVEDRYATRDMAAAPAAPYYTRGGARRKPGRPRKGT